MANTKEPTTMRGSFIRITAENNTQDGLVTYTIDEIKKMIASFCDRYVSTKYAFICHDKDMNADGPVTKHYHIYLKYNTPVPFKYIKEAFPFGNIQKPRSERACVQYLIHKNDSNKTPYDKKEIYTNYEQDEFDALFINDKKIEKIHEQDELEEIIDRIGKGEIRRYNWTNYVDSNLYAKHAPQIDRAFNWFHRDWCDKNRNNKIEVWFITGDSGNGKSTLAQGIADSLVNEGKMNGVCVSSASNDPLQDYGGQDILLLEDLRDNAFKYQDLLKLLDNNTRSSSTSRYNNKTFYGKLIIISSVEPLDKWYPGITEDKKQLYRRITKYFDVMKDVIKEYNIKNGNISNMDFVKSFYNVIPEMAEEAKKRNQSHNIEYDVIKLFEENAKIMRVELSEEQKQAILNTIQYEDELPF